MEKVFSVGELSQILKACFDNPNFSHVPVYGEVYSIRLGKFSYIDLGDQGDKQVNSPLLRCAFSSFYHNDYHLEDIKVGDVIKIVGKLSYYPHGSSVTLWGKEVEILKSQEGKNLLLKKKILEKLDKLGYLDESRKRKIPTYCKKVAILTAEGGAAYQDILKTLHDRFPVSSVLYPVTVQGEGAARSIVHALTLCQKEDYDAILLGRGGGSKTDLSCFDDEKVAMAIATSKIPVITCIGHTIDTAIADRVSDVRAITPTEGASLINPSLEEVNERKDSFDNQLYESFKGILNNYAMSLSAFEEKLNAYSPKNRIRMEKEKLNQYRNNLSLLYSHYLTNKKQEKENYSSQLTKNMLSLLSQKRIQIQSYQSKLLVYDPSNITKNGYALLYKGKDKITSASQLNAGDEVEITYTDGRVKATIKERK